MDKAVVVRVKDVEFFTDFTRLLKEHGMVAGKNDWLCEEWNKKDFIYAGMVTKIVNVVPKGQPGVGHSTFDTLVCLISGLTKKGEEMELYRVVFIGDVVQKLVGDEDISTSHIAQSRIARGDVIAMLEPFKMKPHPVGPPSLSVGPYRSVVWVCPSLKTPLLKKSVPSKIQITNLARSTQKPNKKPASVAEQKETSLDFYPVSQRPRSQQSCSKYQSQEHHSQMECSEDPGPLTQELRHPDRTHDSVPCSGSSWCGHNAGREVRCCAPFPKSGHGCCGCHHCQYGQLSGHGACWHRIPPCQVAMAHSCRAGPSSCTGSAVEYSSHGHTKRVPENNGDSDNNHCKRPRTGQQSPISGTTSGDISEIANIVQMIKSINKKISHMTSPPSFFSTPKKSQTQDEHKRRDETLNPESIMLDNLNKDNSKDDSLKKILPEESRNETSFSKHVRKLFTAKQGSDIYIETEDGQTIDDETVRTSNRTYPPTERHCTGKTFSKKQLGSYSKSQRTQEGSSEMWHCMQKEIKSAKGDSREKSDNIQIVQDVGRKRRDVTKPQMPPLVVETESENKLRKMVKHRVELHLSESNASSSNKILESVDKSYNSENCELIASGRVKPTNSANILKLKYFQEITSGRPTVSDNEDNMKSQSDSFLGHESELVEGKDILKLQSQSPVTLRSQRENKSTPPLNTSSKEIFQTDGGQPNELSGDLVNSGSELDLPTNKEQQIGQLLVTDCENDIVNTKSSFNSSIERVIVDEKSGEEVVQLQIKRNVRTNRNHRKRKSKNKSVNKIMRMTVLEGRVAGELNGAPRKEREEVNNSVDENEQSHIGKSILMDVVAPKSRALTPNDNNKGDLFPCSMGVPSQATEEPHFVSTCGDETQEVDIPNVKLLNFSDAKCGSEVKAECDRRVESGNKGTERATETSPKGCGEPISLGKCANLKSPTCKTKPGDTPTSSPCAKRLRNTSLSQPPSNHPRRKIHETPGAVMDGQDQDKDLMAMNLPEILKMIQHTTKFVLEVFTDSFRPSYSEEKSFDLVSGHCTNCQRIIPFSRLIPNDVSNLSYFCSGCYKKGEEHSANLTYFLTLLVIDSFKNSQEIIITEDEALEIVGMPLDEFLTSGPSAVMNCWQKVKSTLLGDETDNRLKTMQRFVVSVAPLGTRIVSILSGKIGNDTANT